MRIRNGIAQYAGSVHSLAVKCCLLSIGWLLFCSRSFHRSLSCIPAFRAGVNAHSSMLSCNVDVFFGQLRELNKFLLMRSY